MKHSIAVVFLCFGFAACSADQITTTLELAVDATIAAAPAIEKASNASPAVQAAVSAGLNQAESCLSSAHAVLTGSPASTATALQASQIVAACTSASAITLPPGTSADIIAAVNAVSNAVSVFLQTLPKQSVTTLMSRPDFISSFASKAGSSRMNKRKLSAIKKKLEILHSKLRH